MNAQCMEQAVALYRTLHIDGLIANWAQDMKWWLGQSVLSRRWNEIVSNDSGIEQLFGVLVQRFDANGSLKEQLKAQNTMGADRVRFGEQRAAGQRGKG